MITLYENRTLTADSGIAIPIINNRLTQLIKKDLIEYKIENDQLIMLFIFDPLLKHSVVFATKLPTSTGVQYELMINKSTENQYNYGVSFDDPKEATEFFNNRVL